MEGRVVELMHVFQVPGVRSEPVSSRLYQSSYFPFSKAKPGNLVEGCFRAAEFVLKGTWQIVFPKLMAHGR